MGRLGSVCGSTSAVVRVPEMAAWFNEVAARAGLHIGMVCATDYFDIWETVPGDCDRAERYDKGPRAISARAQEIRRLLRGG